MTCELILFVVHIKIVQALGITMPSDMATHAHAWPTRVSEQSGPRLPRRAAVDDSRRKKQRHQALRVTLGPLIPDLVADD